MKKVFSLLLAAVLLLSCGATALAAKADPTRFTDVSSSDWYYSSVASACGAGLMVGVSETSFAPEKGITVAETIKLADTVYKVFNADTSNFGTSQPWYATYVDYAKKRGILSAEFTCANYNAPATRAQFAAILIQAIPSAALPALNTVENGAIPDVSYSDTYGPAVYRLYRAGVFTGSDAAGDFLPGSGITRAEAAAVVCRMVDASQRGKVALRSAAKPVLSGEEIYANCSKAVFYMETYDAFGSLTATASGFFISSDGTAVTCWHALKQGISATIMVANTGKVYDITGVYDYSVKDDWAVVKVDGSGFDYLDVGDAGTDVGGAAVYAIGSPLGLQNSITQGLICNPTRLQDGTSYILFSAAISSGSSGGALINKYGEVIGITAATYVYGQNLNLAINIGYLDFANRETATPLAAAVLSAPDV